MQINIIGSILNCSGFDSHTRNLANTLSKLCDVRLSIPLIPGWERIINDKELEMIKRKPIDDEINLIITNVPSWRLSTNAKYNIAYLIWEGLNIPQSFINECLNEDINKIIVPSEHTKQAIINTINDLTEEECKKILEDEKII